MELLGQFAKKNRMKVRGNGWRLDLRSKKQLVKITGVILKGLFRIVMSTIPFEFVFIL